MIQINRPIAILFLFLLMQCLFSETRVPNLGGLSLNQTKNSIQSTIDTSALFKGWSQASDSNTILLTQNNQRSQNESWALASVKLMFNKTKRIQALSAVFETRDGAGVDSAFHFSCSLLGLPIQEDSLKKGFKTEADWKGSKYKANFFASDKTPEAYLLIGTTSFIQEEDARATRKSE